MARSQPPRVRVRRNHIDTRTIGQVTSHSQVTTVASWVRGKTQATADQSPRAQVGSRTER